MSIQKLKDENFMRNVFINEKMNITQVSKLTGCKRETVKKYALKFGLIENNAGKYTLSEEQADILKSKDKMYAMYICQDMSIADIAEHISVKRDTVIKYLKSHGIVKDIPNKPIKQSIIDTIVHQYTNEKMVLEDIAKSNNISVATVWRYLKSNNIEKIDQVFTEYGELLNNKQWLEHQLFELNKSVTQIASELGIYVPQVTAYMTKHGIPTNYKYKNGSSYEEIIANYIEELGYGFERNIRMEQLNGLECVVFIPRYNIGIEINGLYWHSDKFKDHNYHAKKKQYAEENGIKLLMFTDHEIQNQLVIVKSIIRNALGLSKRIYARNCVVKELTPSETETFLVNNHIQGKAGHPKYRLGLYHNGELVSCMTFGPPRFDKTHNIELIRFCNVVGHTVVGGASKLLKYFINNYPCVSIVSYANRNRSDGALYTTLGFEHIGISKPSYSYVKGSKVVSRYQAMKHKLPNLLEIFDETKSEQHNMLANGFYRLYDCGNHIYSLKPH